MRIGFKYNTVDRTENLNYDDLDREDAVICSEFDGVKKCLD